MSLQEEIASLRRKVERAKKFEMADRADEVLMEEIREYKDTLTCPSCKVRKLAWHLPKKGSVLFYIGGWNTVI